MDDQEIKRRQQEGARLRRELGDLEYRKIKAARQRNRYDQAQDKAREILGEDFTPELASAARPTIEKKIKAKGCMVGIIVVDDGGEHVFMWNAPSLKGTMMPTKQNLNGYKEAVFEAFQKAFGRLTG